MNGAARPATPPEASFDAKIILPPLTGCPCGCEAVRGQQCYEAAPWSLREDETRVQCPAFGHYCGALGVGERAAVGRAGGCCRDWITGAGAA